MLTEKQITTIRRITAPYRLRNVVAFDGPGRQDAKEPGELDIFMEFYQRVSLPELFKVEKLLRAAMEIPVEVITTGKISGRLKIRILPRRIKISAGP